MNWFAAKVKCHTEHKIKKWLEEEKIEHFLPFHTVVIERNGKKIKKEKPWVSGLVFIHVESNAVLSIQQKSLIKLSFLRNKENQTLLIIPEKQMQDFMFMSDFLESTIKIANNSSLKRGDCVRVIKGDFAGIEGELVRVKGHKRVVVRLEGLFSLATAYIPLDYLERI